jgi:outer membrane protein, heavy metal efflux system
VSLLGAIKPMLGLAPADQLILKGDLLPLTLPAGGADWSQRADFQLAQTKAAAAETDVDLAVQNKWQDLSAGIFAAHEEQQGTPTGFAGFRVSIPLPIWNQNQGEVAEKAASAERARLESEALTQTILSEAETARREMLAQAELARETRDKLLPLVMEQTAKLEKAYENGQTDLLTVLGAREQRLQINAAAFEAMRDFHLARIRYEAATGQHAPAATSPP